MYLVDTNVISEARKGKKANRGVQQFFQKTEAADLYLSVQTIGEIRRGLENIRHRGDMPQARKLEKWLDFVSADYADRILSFDEECAQVWGRLMSPHHQHPIDKQIAAIALIHDLIVVTRNVDDFEGRVREPIIPLLLEVVSERNGTQAIEFALCNKELLRGSTNGRNGSRPALANVGFRQAQF